ncbi:flavin-containing amine oxidasedehydrogenase [Seminavis robusta]|uniref:Flavin-containing amine oxidasedehydrogenase n=1 Tax=Seminavis robusta TaxID=568900 RepID=A0A9N8DF76_9STRA|nr:flavin-containing amine oxidasedehydrogenase [Seminavis robusta]|eukprot:Sro64_g036420.1 flavin-containing amine oxidasedehydrogenase (566) ;mRNA; f:105852-107549
MTHSTFNRAAWSKGSGAVRVLQPKISAEESRYYPDNMTADTTSSNKKRIAIVGGGAAGVSTAWSLARSVHEKVDVTIIEPCPSLGGVACTKYLDNQQFLNYGVQGGTPASHRNIIAFLKEFNEDIDDAHLSVSFGKGPYHWTNYQDSPLQQTLQKDIRRFGTLLKWISRLEFVTLFLSIDTVLEWACLSQEFRDRMVYPLVALFFGTGNQTPHMSAAVVARVFNDPSLALFEYSPDRLIDSEPTNFAFKSLDQFYNGKVRPFLEDKGVKVLTSHRVDSVVSRSRKDGVTLQISNLAGSTDTDCRAGGDQKLLSNDSLLPLQDAAQVLPESSTESSQQGWEELFDEIVFACPANVALQILGQNATFWERRILGSVEYFHDLSVTHTDRAYMTKYYEDVEKERAIYFIKTYEQDPKLLEMGFDLSGYQSSISKGIINQSSPEQQQPERVFQTIFLDKKRKKDLWSLDEIDDNKIIDRSWWSAFAHTMKHFRSVVPFVWLLHRQNAVQATHTYYAGSWMLINTHDIAVVSGLAVAQRLGAPYPFADNSLALALYKTFWMVGHLTVWRK